MNKLALFIFGFLYSAMASTQPTQDPLAASRIGDRPWDSVATRSQVIAPNGMVATSNPLATQIALDILKKGGSAVDAAIAANAALGLMEPQMCGLGGDLFAIVWDPASKKLHGLNASGRSSLSVSFQRMQELRRQRRTANQANNALMVTVPGAVDGWYELHKKFGRISLTELLQPTIDYARNGFPIVLEVARNTQQIADYLEYPRQQLLGSENFKQLYLINDKSPIEGQRQKNEDLASTLNLIAKGGRDEFYRGVIAKKIVRYLNQVGGVLTEEDFARHSSTWIEPVSINYRGYDIHELPPNGQGIAALQQLNILEGFDLKAMGHNSADYLHVHVEAKKLAYEDRARFYADPDFYQAPLEHLLSKDYAAERRALISMDKTLTKIEYPDAAEIEHGDTIYLSVADSNGMMVSFIQSIFNTYGSLLVPDDLGFALQDRGRGFSMQAGHPNVYAPGKRPFHTIIPAFITKDGNPVMSFGVMGGAMQPQGHAQIVSNFIDFGMNVQQAGDAARYRHDGSTEPSANRIMTDGGTLNVESGVLPAVVEKLQQKGHRVRVRSGGYGGYQAVVWDEELQVYKGGTEMRKDGQAAGY